LFPIKPTIVPDIFFLVPEILEIVPESILRAHTKRQPISPIKRDYFSGKKWLILECHPFNFRRNIRYHIPHEWGELS